MPETTIVRGQVMTLNNEIVNKPGHGRYVPGADRAKAVA